MTNTDILLEDLEDVLDDATSIPLSKKYAVDVDKIKTIIEDIRLNTPQETKQAKAIVDSRNNILEEAKKEYKEMLGGMFGNASARVVIEEFLSGIECSVFVLTDGKNYKILPEAKDYKRIRKPT